jgi:hypothetical protein
MNVFCERKIQRRDAEYRALCRSSAPTGPALQKPVIERQGGFA